MRKITVTILACAALCACNKEIDSVKAPQKVFEVDNAYVVVSIKDVGASTRASSDGFENGTAAEYAVKDATFYFYDNAGIFVNEASVWNGGAATGNQTGNIEFKGKTVVMLNGLTSKNYPKYVVTVLNKPADFAPANTLAGLEGQLADQEALGIMQGDNTYFTMSTSSYGTSEFYYATEVSENDFYTEPVADDLTDINPVEIYVERLAAKVTVSIDIEYAQDESVKAKTLTCYPIIGIDFAEGADQTPQLYVSFDGWRLNAIARRSNMVKTIDTKWTSTTLGFDWNDEANHRSYWGKSFNYGLGNASDYPQSSQGHTPDDEKDATQLNEYLEYVSLADPNEMGAYEYCAENTNTVGDTGILGSKNSSAITSVLLKATLWQYDEDTQSLIAPDLVRFEGVLFTFDGFLSYALEHQNLAGKLNVWYTEDNGETYKQIDQSFVELAEKVDGYVQVVLTDDAKGTQFYSIDGYEGDIPVTSKLSTTDVQAVLDDFNTYAYNDGKDGANGYKGGSMYYNIPIEHLNDTFAEDGSLAEANYGIVRNHQYYVSIIDVENIGKGIFDPDKVLVPTIDFDLYYVAAQVNILSWKLVSQGVIL